mmetsp:Transcript_23246/g.46377  ORF Transcript_23246/g.46377 Transcript_23246/m.46377 type:complete len:592 (+) Transcript_23246:152-1927(+)
MFQVNTGFNSGQREDVNTSETPQYTKGEQQPKQCRDGIFALLFYGHLAAIAWMCVTYIPSAISLSTSQFGIKSPSQFNSTDNSTEFLSVMPSRSPTIKSTAFPSIFPPTPNQGESSTGIAESPEIASLPTDNSPESSSLTETVNSTALPSVISQSATQVEGSEIAVPVSQSPNQVRRSTEIVNSTATGGFDDFELSNDTTNGIIMLVIVPAVAGFIASLCGLAMIIACAKTIIHLSLIFAILSSIAVVVVSLASGQMLFALLAVLMLVLTTCYYFSVKDRIPFAAANLNTATTAVKENLFGLLASTVFFDLLGFLYSVAWGLGYMGIFAEWGCFSESNVCETDGIRGAVIFFLLLAMFWTSQVFMNLGQVTTAGTVGSWWFNPEDSGSCGSGIRGAFSRAMTTSFGSICFGSLLVAIIEALKTMVQNERAQSDGPDILLCIVQCILQCLEDILEYFNKWAMVYVGLYGYGYIEAGKNVITLFKARGWTTVITEDLGSRAISFLAFILSLVVGCAGLVIKMIDQDLFLPYWAAYLTCFIISYIVILVMFGVVDSALNTVIVLYAEAPSEFQANHPELSEEMREEWLKVYPDL